MYLYCTVGGFCCGFIFGFALLISPRLDQEGTVLGQRTYQKVFSILGALLLLAIVIFAYAVLMLPIRVVCSWCHYISCVSTSWWACPDQCSLLENLGNGSLVILCPTAINHTVTANFSSELCLSEC